MPTEENVKPDQQDLVALDHLTEWLSTPEGVERVTRAFKASDQLASLIQKEAFASSGPENRSRSPRK